MSVDLPAGAPASRPDHVQGLEHETLLHRLKGAASDEERALAHEELSRRLERVPQPRANAPPPWDPDNGGC